MVRTLDALALVSLPDGALVPRIAALWCRAYDDRYPHSADEMIQWVWDEFGPVIDPDDEPKMGKELLDATRQQIRLRGRRKERHAHRDPLKERESYDERVGRLLQSRLGRARHWVSRQRILDKGQTSCHYIDGAIYSGIVAGIIPVAMSLKRVRNPSLLVYRQGAAEAKSWWVPGHINTVADAFIWVIPPEAAEFLEIAGSRVEHDAEAQACRLITQFGTKTLPWRELIPNR